MRAIEHTDRVIDHTGGVLSDRVHTVRDRLHTMHRYGSARFVMILDAELVRALTRSFTAQLPPDWSRYSRVRDCFDVAPRQDSVARLTWLHGRSVTLRTSTIHGALT